MNPFVNPNKRDVSLPDGCKDLVDVLQQPKEEKFSIGSLVEFLLCQTPDGIQPDRIRRFVGLLLLQAQQEQATELIIGPALPQGTPIKCNVCGSWHDMAPFPSRIRHDVISELARLAKFPAGQTTGEGVLDLIVFSSRLKWNLVITSDDGECKLTRIED